MRLLGRVILNKFKMFYSYIFERFVMPGLLFIESCYILNVFSKAVFRENQELGICDLMSNDFLKKKTEIIT